MNTETGKMILNVKKGGKIQVFSILLREGECIFNRGKMTSPI